ncbi:MAG: flagellar biosynthetic protein FliQ [Hydrogenophilales bacterium 16-64-46]|nr:MAG: flagellar biosynthetic protein FliQ [Hydrogenophilales bacterium 12-64-13]OYZ06339.1 MAG: flagellar biosynthetic protein FliQ [Hydrogenophilales bacterium 16-64-46]OZA38762.1 MAG: flagellar biosynthetic protein FliQ [Hydrogenophilales bacterium 17-64-34]HQS99614.1 flagellar biosynthetic protein FliQ [Thiobacillus sp.]
MEDLARDALWLTLTVAAPVLLAALAVAFVISLVQATTQILEPTLSFVPKLIVVGLVLALLGGWMSGLVVDFARTLLTDFPALIE